MKSRRSWLNVGLVAFWIIPAIWLSRLHGRKIIINYRDGQAKQHLRDWPSAVPTLRRADAQLRRVETRGMDSIFRMGASGFNPRYNADRYDR